MKNVYNLFIVFVLMFGVVSVAEAQKQKGGKKSKRSAKNSKKKGKSSKKSSSPSKRNAKSNKAEAKQWKDKLKKLTPAQYKNLVEDYYALKDQVSELEGVSNCSEEIAKKDDLISKYKQEVARLKEANKSANKVSLSKSSKRNLDNKGVLFRIQIGSYEKIDLSAYAGQENFDVEKNGTAQKFTIGRFRSYREADNLKKYLQKMGVKDAWVVAYKDGTRVNIQEVLRSSSR